MRLCSRVLSKLFRIWFALTYRSRLGFLGGHAFLYRPFRIDGHSGIEIGDGSVMQRGGWLYCGDLDGRRARLHIGKGCVFGYNNHITAVSDVQIGDHVLTANNVYISDNLHAYEDVERPVMHQPVRLKQAVSIGDGSWIGENACIIGARIGRNCVIGANAVVTRDIPDYSVAVGAPAVVIKQYDPLSQKWINKEPGRHSE